MDEKILKDMEERIESYTKAAKTPDFKVGEKRAKRVDEVRKGTPIGGGPANPFRVAENFEQLNKETRWSKTEFSKNSSNGHVIARVHVQDPRIPEGVVLPRISIDDEETPPTQ